MDRTRLVGANVLFIKLGCKFPTSNDDAKKQCENERGENMAKTNKTEREKRKKNIRYRNCFR